MKALAANSFAIFGLSLLLCAPLRAAADLLAHANDQTLWIAQVRSVRTLDTSVRYRALGGELQWRELPKLTGRAVDLASRGSSLAVLMESGEWLLVWPSGISTGPALPDGGKIIALANQSDVLYALGLTGGARASTTSTAPATTVAPSEASSATQPATAPVERLMLFKFDGAAWSAIANLPDDIPPRTSDPALAIVDQHPMVAVAAPQQSIRVIELTPQKTWTERGTVAPGFVPRQFQLLSVAQRPLLWIAGNNDAGVIVTGGERWSEPKKLELNTAVVSPRGRAFVFAAGNLRLFIEDEADKIYEQCYRLDGARVGDLTPLAQPRPLVSPGYNNWSTLAILAAVFFVMFGSARRRAPEDEVKIAGLLLAPPSLRLLAGLIDLLPIIVTAAALQMRLGVTDLAELPLMPLLIAGGVYLAHTLIGELAMGRSIGKIIAGVRVIMTDGRPPTAGAIVVRNLMRVIDLFPPFLVLILFMPLRQRLGDIVARTTVVLASAATETDQDQTPRSDESE